MSAAARRASVADAPASSHAFHGHSGAGIVFHARGANGFVRKTAAGIDANDRLMAQAHKQQALHRMALPFPRVLAQGFDEAGRARFDMEYLPGRSVADAVINAAAFDAGALVRTVQRMLWLFAPAAGGPLPARLFRDKIESIADGAPALGDAARRLLACDWDGIPESPCHGDLTLENMLITTARTVAFIDCDAPWVSSWWLDFGKLYQDIEGHWCLRGLYASGAQAQRVNAIQKLALLGRSFGALATAFDPALPPRLPQLAALGLLRAAPYAQTQTTRDFLCSRIAYLMEQTP